MGRAPGTDPGFALGRSTRKFAVPSRSTQGTQQSAEDLLAAALDALNPDDLSPREAMDALYRLKEQAAKKT